MSYHKKVPIQVKSLVSHKHKQNTQTLKKSVNCELDSHTYEGFHTIVQEKVQRLLSLLVTLSFRTLWVRNPKNWKLFIQSYASTKR